MSAARAEPSKNVGLDLDPGSHGSADEMAQRMSPGSRGGQSSRLHERLHDRMIMRNPPERAVPEEVSPTVADVADHPLTRVAP